MDETGYSDHLLRVPTISHSTVSLLRESVIAAVFLEIVVGYWSGGSPLIQKSSFWFGSGNALDCDHPTSCVKLCLYDGRLIDFFMRICPK